jgi:hypothetical protein
MAHNDIQDLAQSVLQRMQGIDGWLSVDEAALLLQITAAAVTELPPTSAVVEVGSYFGRSTVVIGSVVKSLAPTVKVYAIDPHEGEITGDAEVVLRLAPSFGKFQETIRDAGLCEVVQPVQRRSYEVGWERPISLLMIDGLHDYDNVSRDFKHFGPWVLPGAYVAFHDYSHYFPGVIHFVNQVLRMSEYQQVEKADSLVILRRH